MNEMMMKNRIERIHQQSPESKGSPIAVLRHLNQSSDCGFQFQKEKFNQGIDIFGISNKQTSHFSKYWNIKFGFNHFYKKKKANNGEEVADNSEHKENDEDHQTQKHKLETNTNTASRSVFGIKSSSLAMPPNFWLNWSSSNFFPQVDIRKDISATRNHKFRENSTISNSPTVFSKTSRDNFNVPDLILSTKKKAHKIDKVKEGLIRHIRIKSKLKELKDTIDDKNEVYNSSKYINSWNMSIWSDPAEMSFLSPELTTNSRLLSPTILPNVTKNATPIAVPRPMLGKYYELYISNYLFREIK